MIKIISIILVILVILVVCGVMVYLEQDGIIKFEIMEVDGYSADGKWCMDNDGNKTFCTPNDKNYKKGDLIFVLYNIDDLFHFNILSW